MTIEESVKPFSKLPVTMIEDLSINATTMGVYAALAKFSDNDTRKCFPSRKTIASYCGMSNNTLSRHLKILADSGYVKIERRFTKEQGSVSNLYTLVEV